MKLLMFSTDRSAFDPESQFVSRLIEYSALFEEINVVIGGADAIGATSIGDNVILWPVGPLFLPQAYVIGKKILTGNAESYRITAQEELGGIVAYLLARRFRVPWQMQVHTDIASPYFRAHSFINKVRYRIARFLLPRASCVRVVGSRVKQGVEALAALASSAAILPIYASRDAILERNYDDPYFDFVILTVSRLTSEKNVSLAIHAVARLVKEYPQTTLRIVGDGPERAALEALAHELDLGAHVQFTGSLEGSATILSSYRKAAHAYLQTSWYEGYGLAVVEAMSAGLPVVMTNAGVAGELVVDGESGLVVEPGDEEALFGALKRVRSDRELRERIGKRALEISRGLLTKEEYLEAFRRTLETCGT